MEHRKRENGAVATQVDLEAISATYNTITDKDAQLDTYVLRLYYHLSVADQGGYFRLLHVIRIDANLAPQCT